MNKFFEKITGIAKIREAAKEATEEALRLADEANKEAKAAVEEAKKANCDAELVIAKAKEAEELAKASPKERATIKKEPWVDVVKVNVNDGNVRNGFFELDWNELFINKLRAEGYGVNGDPDEDVVDRWFRELCAGIVIDGDYGGVVTGNLDIAEIAKSNQVPK